MNSNKESDLSIRLASENFQKLNEKLNSTIPNYVNTSTAKVFSNPRNLVAIINLEKQQMIDDAVDKLSKRLHLRVLLFVRDEECTYKAILYAMPYHDEMYVIHLTSDSYGVIDKIHIVLYDSMESMQEDILAARNSAEGERLQWSTDVKIIKDFG